MKSNAIARIVIYSIVILLLVGLLVTCIAVGSFMIITDAGSNNLTSHETTVPASEVDNLSIEWAAGSVIIQTADTANITVTESGHYNEKYNMVCTQSGSTLKIQYAKSTLMVGFGSVPEKELVITVPENWNVKEIELDGAALNVDISGITVEELNLDGAAMKLSFNGQLSSMDVDGAACELHIVCGNEPDTIEIDGASCEIDLTLPAGCGFLVQMDGLGCSFDSNVDFTSKNGSYSYGDRHCTLNIDGLSCEVTVREN